MKRSLFLILGTLMCLLCLAGGAAADGYPESAHPYASMSDITWNYTHPTEAEYISVTFSEESYLEDGWDYLILTDETGKTFEFTGYALAGAELFLEGDSFTLRLISDDRFEEYGFAITSIKAITEDDWAEPCITINNGIVTNVTGGKPGSKLVIPETHNGVPVTAIAASALSGTSFGEVVLPDTLTRIDSHAFDSCQYLECINLPDGLTEIGYCCFYNCAKLKSIEIPAGVTSINSMSFYNCTSLKSVKLPKGLLQLRDGAFQHCTSLTSIEIPAGITSLQWSIFNSCTSMKTVTLKAPVTDLGMYCFAGCSSLETINGYLGYVDDHALYRSNALKSVTLAKSVETVPNGLMLLPHVVISVHQGSKTLPQLIEHGHPYRIIETDEVFNVVSTSATTVDAKVDAIVAAIIRPGMSDYQKALALHNWLTLNANYDLTYSNYHANGVLLKGTGVCQSYAEAYELLLDEVGIPNCLEYGSNHVWNMLELDGEWYHVDATWNDPISGDVAGGYENWDFFGLSNYALQGVSNHECYNKPQIANGYKYNYNYRNGMLDDRLSNVQELIEAQLLSGQWSFTVTPSNFSNNDYGIANRTAALVVMDTQYQLYGKDVPLTITYDDASTTFTVVAAMSVPDAAFPAALQVVDEEAFRGSAIRVISLPEGVTSIGAFAFSDCPRLWQIHIPASVKEIHETAFYGVQGLCIFGVPGSTAEDFANAHDYGFCPVE